MVETGVRDGEMDCCFSNKNIQVGTRALSYVKCICVRDGSESFETIVAADRSLCGAEGLD